MPPPRAQDGFLDLRQADFSQGAIPLSGEWELYWDELRTVAQFSRGQAGGTREHMDTGEPWAKHRMASGKLMPATGRMTMRLRVRMPPLTDADGRWAVKAVTGSRALSLHVYDRQGREVVPPLSAGVVSADLDQVRDGKRVLIATLWPQPAAAAQEADAQALADTELEFILQVASKDHIDRSGNVHVYIGRESRVRAEQSASEQVRLAIIGLTMVIGLYHLAMFAIRRSERAPLYFGLFCVAIAARQFMLYGFFEARLLGNGWPAGLAWERQERVEYCGFFLAVPLFIMYLRALFPAQFSAWVNHALIVVALATCGWTLLVPMRLAAAAVTSYERLTLCLALYVVWGMGRVLLYGQARDLQTARFIAMGTLLLVLSAANDILNNNVVIKTFISEHYGMFAFIFCQAFVLAVNNARARVRAERLAEELDQKNATLSRLDQMKDEFLANTSHELRTPLSGILGLAEALLSGERLPSKAREQLRLIVASGKRLTSLVNDILDFAKLRHDHLTLQRRPVDPRVVTDLVLALARPLTGGKQLALENKLPEQTPYVLADENRLQQILTNLVGNAIKFTPDGVISVTAAVENRMLAITVSDTGIGIPESEHGRIFEWFSQVDGSAEREHGGTGLGLTITKKLVELHGGTIRLRSVPGQGSHFTFTLPLADAAAAATQASDVQVSGQQLAVDSPFGPPGMSYGALPPVSSSQPRIETLGGTGKRAERFHVLVVDDDPVNRAVLTGHLGSAGYEVSEESGGPAALARLGRERFDALVLDVMMPKMTGYEVLRNLRQRYPASELPVLLLTAKTQEQDIAEGFSAGTNDYLTKPFSRTELLARIATHITLAKTNIAYGRFVPHEFIQLLGKQNVVYVDIGDHVLLPQMTILFCDVRGFTALSESLDARGVFAMLGGLLQRVSPILRQHRGFVDKFIGDAVMGLFPVSAADAAQAAVEIHQAVQRFAAEEPGFANLGVGIGVHTGSTMLGTIGDAMRMEATVLSDAVNLAARLEGLTRIFGVGILISDDALGRIGDPAALLPRPLGQVRVKGKKLPIGVHELLASDPAPLREHKERHLGAFAAALSHYQSGQLEAARAAFLALRQAAREAGLDDGPVELYLAQCEHFRQQPLPADWTGCLEFAVK